MSHTANVLRIWVDGDRMSLMSSKFHAIFVYQSFLKVISACNDSLWIKWWNRANWQCDWFWNKDVFMVRKMKSVRYYDVRKNLSHRHLCNYTRLNSNIILSTCIVKIILMTSPFPPHLRTLTTTPKENSKSISGIKKMKLKDFMNREQESFQWKKNTKRNVNIFEARMSLKNDSIEALVSLVQFLLVWCSWKNQHLNPKQTERKTYNKFLRYFSLEKCLSAPVCRWNF